MGQGKQQFPRGYGVLAALRRLGRVPQSLAILIDDRRIRRRHDRGEFNVVLGREIELHRQAIIDQPRP